MQRLNTILAFAACTVPMAACSLTQDAREPADRVDFGPVYCDPLAGQSSEFMLPAPGSADERQVPSSRALADAIVAGAMDRDVGSVGRLARTRFAARV